MERIDFVVPWVDGSDPAWQKSRAAYAHDTFNARISAQYRDWGTLPYWFRAVEKYAPWVNRIHFVTCGQCPNWLNASHPKLHLVNHRDYIPTVYLPTFSANPIELNLHRIDGLSEQFVYFNDDTFLTAPVREGDFFRNDLPCDSAQLSSLIPSVKGESITYILFNDLLLLNSHFEKRESVRENLTKWFSLKYGKDIIRNLYYLPIGKFSGFVNPHLPNSFLKSTFREVWEAEFDRLDAVCRNRFRSERDINQYLMRYWQLASGHFTPRYPRMGACFMVGQDSKEIKTALIKRCYKMICINDNPQMDDISKEKERLLDVFERTFPEKSSFEV